MADYSGLTGEDEDATHRRLSEYLDFISGSVEYQHGRVMHYAGDALLDEWKGNRLLDGSAGMQACDIDALVDLTVLASNGAGTHPLATD